MFRVHFTLVDIFVANINKIVRSVDIDMIIRKLFGQPIVGVAEIMKWTSFSPQGAYNVIDRLKRLKILSLLGDASYGQKYIYADYYGIFDDSFGSESGAGSGSNSGSSNGA